ncbi:MAG: hypothetical protein ACPG7F_19735, partial [Aggregatilineales bacterium]
MSALNEAAKGIPKPAYTQIPNVLLDNLDQFDNDELRVILVAMRSTLGYHKTRHPMSQSFFASNGGVSDSSAKRGVKKAKARGWLTDCGTEKGLRGAKIYEISFSDPVQSEPTNNTDIVQDEPSTGVNMNQVHSSNRATYKERDKESKKKNTIAPVPDAIPISDMDDAIYGNVPESVQYESSEENPDVAKNAITDSVKENEITVLPKSQKEKSSAKKEKGKLHAPAWGSDKQVRQDAMTAMLMIAWELDPEDRFDKGKSKGLGQYRREAKYLLEVGIHPGNLGDLWRYVKKLARDGNWSAFSVASLRRYALEFLAQKDKPGNPEAMTVAERLDPNAPHYQPPPGSKPLTEEQKQAF